MWLSVDSKAFNKLQSRRGGASGEFNEILPYKSQLIIGWNYHNSDLSRETNWIYEFRQLNKIII